MFQGLSNLTGLLKNAREIQARAQEMKGRLSTLKVQGSSGGGMVVVEATGDQKISSVSIEPSLLAGGDRELLEDLIISAVNQALEQAKEAASRELAGMAEGLGVPGMEEALSKLGLG